MISTTLDLNTKNKIKKVKSTNMKEIILRKKLRKRSKRKREDKAQALMKNIRKTKERVRSMMLIRKSRDIIIAKNSDNQLSATIAEKIIMRNNVLDHSRDFAGTLQIQKQVVNQEAETREKICQNNPSDRREENQVITTRNQRKFDFQAVRAMRREERETRTKREERDIAAVHHLHHPHPHLLHQKTGTKEENSD